MSIHPVIIKDLGIQDYIPTWDAMKKFTIERNESTQDELWIVQHPPVYTLGLNGKNEHILNPSKIPIVKIDRGGQITYHAPGQLIVYCMVDLKRRGYGVKDFVIHLQNSIQELLSEYNIKSHLVDKAPGVYVDNKKIAALGLRVKRNCTYHGLSINIDMDLKPFKDINPCGYPDLKVTQFSDCYLSNHSSLNPSALNFSSTDYFTNITQKFIPILKNRIYLQN